MILKPFFWFRIINYLITSSSRSKLEGMIVVQFEHKGG